MLMFCMPAMAAIVVGTFAVYLTCAVRPELLSVTVAVTVSTVPRLSVTASALK